MKNYDIEDYKLHEKYYGDEYPEFMNEQFKPVQVKPVLHSYDTKGGNGNIRAFLKLSVFVAVVFGLWIGFAG